MADVSPEFHERMQAFFQQFARDTQETTERIERLRIEIAVRDFMRELDEFGERREG